MKNLVKKIYRPVRAVLVSVLCTVAGLCVILYALLSSPAVSTKIKGIVEEEVSSFLGGWVAIERLEIRPFSQVELYGVHLYTPEGPECISIGEVGAGIDIYSLVLKREIIVTYASIDGLNAKILQPAEGAPLNIDYIIEAFKPRDKRKEPAKFDLAIHSITIRRSNISFESKDPRLSLFNSSLTNLKADIDLPRLSNEEVGIHVRRLSADLKSNFASGPLEISGNALLKGTVLDTEQLHIRLGRSEFVPDVSRIDFSKPLGNLSVAIHDTRIYPRDIAFPALARWVEMLPDEPLDLDLVAKLRCNGDPKDPENELSLDIEKFLLRSDYAEISLGRTEVSRQGGVWSVCGPALSVHLDARRLSLPQNVQRVGELGLLALQADFDRILYDPGTSSLQTRNPRVELETSAGYAKVSSANIQLAPGKGNIPLLSLTDLSLDADLEISSVALAGSLSSPSLNLRGQDISGSLSADFERIKYENFEFTDVQVDARKSGENAAVDLAVTNPDASLTFSGEVTLPGGRLTLPSAVAASMEIERLEPAAWGILPQLSDYAFSGNIEADIQSLSPTRPKGTLSLERFSMTQLSTGKTLRLDQLTAEATPELLTLDSDFLDATVKIGGTEREPDYDLSATVKPDNSWTEFLNLPVRLLTNIPVTASFTPTSLESLTLSAPYLQQGANKLIKNTSLSLSLKGESKDARTATLHAATSMPGKQGYVDLSIGLNAPVPYPLGINPTNLHFLSANPATLQADWDFNRERAYNGSVALMASMQPGEGSPLTVKVLPTSFYVNDSRWDVEPAKITLFNPNRLSALLIDVDGINVHHGTQHVTASGKASALASDILRINLQDIDLDWLFETLAINHVEFGGNATGEVTGHSLLSGNPVAYTDAILVKDLTYNGGLLGDAVLSSRWLQDQKEVTIGARIFDKSLPVDEGRIPNAIVDGGIWVTRDSLSFDFDANKVNVAFMRPFVEAFTSEMKGRASGKCKLFGTFADIDLVGRVFADTVSMKVDYTNVTYSGRDSVIMTPGRIDIPHITLYDSFGNKGEMTGYVTHRYFHEPSFEFKVTDCRDLLGYDIRPGALTPEGMPMRWNGRIFASGSGSITGVPGYIGINLDMTTSPHSDFTFILDEHMEAGQYDFLTFSDRRKEAHELLVREKDVLDGEPDFEAMFRKKVKEEKRLRPSVIDVNLNATVTPAAHLTLVMDPKSGDKIKATGQGAIRLTYSSENDDFRMFGRYTLEEGTYRFSLQDIILRDFTIRPGSTVNFNGDPYNAVLNIDALYRVNTNLQDLDPAFAQDKDLQRSNVPVDAVLSVTGPLTTPVINFDIELPTLSSDQTRRVKSVISTDDMMSRQIIYLLALNRFYTPEYMHGASTSAPGSEFTAVASSTISNQLSSMLGQISDNWSLSPTFRSDKGDFSDLEFDLALSSRLLNNRLLLNGNFGYRDRATSNTTFVGDFDLEYLLNSTGNWRLKAYNHFNDQNYYLRSALTTQGIGVVFRKDFNDMFKFLRPKREKETEEKTGEGSAGGPEE